MLSRGRDIEDKHPVLERPSPGSRPCDDDEQYEDTRKHRPTVETRTAPTSDIVVQNDDRIYSAFELQATTIEIVCFWSAYGWMRARVFRESVCARVYVCSRLENVNFT